MTYDHWKTTEPDPFAFDERPGWRERQREERHKPRPAPRKPYSSPTHSPVWWGRCPHFRPRTEADANKPTRL
jgi:hypothetical protein